MKTAGNRIQELAVSQDVIIPTRKGHLEGELKVPAGASGVILFAHRSGSSRHSPCNQYVERVIREAGAGTFLFDLLTGPEETEDNITAALRFDINFLAERLVTAIDSLTAQSNLGDLKLGYFDSSTGGAAALVAAAKLGKRKL